jgi:hypothetical protein
MKVEMKWRREEDVFGLKSDEIWRSGIGVEILKLSIKFDGVQSTILDQKA